MRSKIYNKTKAKVQEWVSTSVLESEPSDDLKYASADYFVYNLLNCVHFYDIFKELPKDAIVVELSPHSVFKQIVSETLGNEFLYIVNGKGLKRYKSGSLLEFNRKTL